MFKVGDKVFLLPEKECVREDSPGYVHRHMTELEGKLLTISMFTFGGRWVKIIECDHDFSYDIRWFITAANKD